MALSVAITLAAGEGTRMHSSKPRMLYAFAGKIFLNRVMDLVTVLNPDTSAVVMHLQARCIAGAARSYDEQVTIVNQDDIPGTGRAVQCAMAQFIKAGKVDGPVSIAAPDMPLFDNEMLRRLVGFHTASSDGATALAAVLGDPAGYGRIVRDREGNVLRITEQKDANRSELAVQEVNVSVYVFGAPVLAETIVGLKSNNAQDELYLTDTLEAVKAAGKVGAFAAPDPLIARDMNDRVQLAALSRTYNCRVCERWVCDGVTILDPEATWIEDDVQIGRDATILPGFFLRGRMTVGEDAIVGPYTTLIDTTVDEGAVVERSRVQESHIGARTNIGPRTYLCPGNELGEDAKVDALVGMKKAHIDNGIRVPCLSYVGNAQLGNHINIDGGIITTNYDGVHRNRITIGSDCHVDVSNLFVAPAEVGDNVTTDADFMVRRAVSGDTMVYSEST